MSASVTNQAQMRATILSGSPKKKAAWRSLSNMKFGSRPGVVITCQKTKIATSSPACQGHRLAGADLHARCHSQAAFSCWA